MLDRPDSATLLRGMAKALTDDVLPTTSGPARHAVRVVANLCQILEREFELGNAQAEATRRDLSALLGRDASLPDLVEALDRILSGDEGGAEGTGADFDVSARRVVLADVERRLAIDKPGYCSAKNSSESSAQSSRGAS